MTVHSKYGASSIATVLACPGHVNACDGLANETNPAAEQGTAAHELAEWCLNLGFNAKHGIGRTFNNHVVDQVMADDVQIYINHIRSLRIKHPNGVSEIEVPVKMSSVASDVFGTADHIMYDVGSRTLYVDDLKYGFGIVDEEENAQTAHYAVSALDTFGLWFAIENVVCTIVQPRGDHIRGAIRSVTYTIEELMAWRDKFAMGIAAARKPDAPRNAGEHCKYCRAQGDCRQRMIRTVFMCSLDAPLKQATDEEINQFLREIAAMQKHIEAVQQHALILARGGKRYTDFKLVKSRVRAICKDEEALVKAVVAKGIKREELYNPGKLKGKSVLAKTIGQDLANQFFETPLAETQLVPLTNSSTAVSNDASGVFTKVD